MFEKNPLTPAERELEAALRLLHPVPLAPDREKLVFELGRRAGRQRTWIWQSTTAALAASLLLTFILRPAPVQRDRNVASAPQPLNPITRSINPRPSPDLSDTVITTSNYLNLRNRMLIQGPLAFPRSRPSLMSNSPTLQNLLKENMQDSTPSSPANGNTL